MLENILLLNLIVSVGLVIMASDRGVGDRGLIPS